MGLRVSGMFMIYRCKGKGLGSRVLRVRVSGLFKYTMNLEVDQAPVPKMAILENRPSPQT